MRILTLASITVLLLVIAGCGQGMEAPFDQILPDCKSSKGEFQTSSETSKSGQSYQQHGQIRHTRVCSWDDSKIEPSVQVFKEPLIAQAFIDGMVEGLSDRPNYAIPASKGLMRRQYQKTITELAWVQYWTTSSPYPDTGYGVSDIHFRIGRYVGNVAILPAEWDVATLNRLEPVMLEMVDKLIKSLHRLNMEEGNQPYLSERGAIQKVIEHISTGEPHQRQERVADWKEPPECPKLSDEATNAMAESIVAEIMKESTSGSDKAHQAWNKWEATCVDAPSEVWESEGRPTVDRLWSENLECPEWGEIKLESGSLPDLSTLKWEADYYDKIAAGKHLEELKEILSSIDFSELGSDSSLNQHLEGFSKPGWYVSHTTFGEPSCSWIWDEAMGIVWVTN